MIYRQYVLHFESRETPFPDQALVKLRLLARDMGTDADTLLNMDKKPLKYLLTRLNLQRLHKAIYGEDLEISSDNLNWLDTRFTDDETHYNDQI